VKPIHVVIIERVYSQAWRERTTGELAAKIRIDRGSRWWDSIKDIPSNYRRDMLHAHPGRHKQQEAIFVETWGRDWRERLVDTEDKKQWMKGSRNFVRDACKALKLPFPDEIGPDGGAASPPPSKKARLDMWDMGALPIPKPLARDSLWARVAARPQLEIVVDNQVLASIANGTAGVLNEYYRIPFNRIRDRIRRLFQEHFEYKGTFLDPIDWRPREHNAAADHVANCVMHDNCDIDTLQMSDFSEDAADTVGYQVFTDGGFAGGSGAIGVVFHRIRFNGIGFESIPMGALGRRLHSATSAFFTEVAALELALDTLTRVRAFTKP
jgi:hypothetical protein